jgi:amino acid adenylation domain-containing protein
VQRSAAGPALASLQRTRKGVQRRIETEFSTVHELSHGARPGVAVTTTLIDSFLRSSEEHPDRPALEVEGRRLTYTELRREAEAISSLLTNAELDGPPLCAVFAYRSVTAFAGVLGTLHSGRGYVPLNRTFPPERSRYMLERAGCAAMIVDDATLPQLAEVLDGVERRLLIVVPGTADLDGLRAQHPRHDFAGRAELDAQPEAELVRVDEEAIAYILFTSGSTGMPKGVGVTHRNVRAFLDYVVPLYDIQPTDRFGQLFDLTFDLSNFDMFAAWERGACVCCPADLNRPDRFIGEAELTIWFSVPSQAIVMQRLGMLKPESFPTLRLSLFCGEPLPDDIAAAWAKAAPGSAVENLYGPTELTIAMTHYRWNPERRDGAHLGIVPIGWPYPDMEVLVVDERLRPVPDGEPGELISTGPQMTPGYWQDQEKTAERYVVPPGESVPYYRTGDRVKRAGPDGPLVYLGRVDHQIKVRGHRVELGEIEAVIREESGASGVVAVGFPRTAAGVAGIEAFIEGEATAAEARDVIARASKRLPSFMVPRRIHALERLPLNANGKYDRNALLARLEEAR